MPLGLGISFIVSSYLHALCRSFLGEFFLRYTVLLNTHRSLNILLIRREDKSSI